MHWTVFLVFLFNLSQCTCGVLLRETQVDVVAEPLTTVLHPNLQLGFGVAYVCGESALQERESSYNYFIQRKTQYNTGIVLSVGNNTRGTIPCPNVTRYSKSDWMALAEERYRLQFSLNDMRVYYTEHIVSQISADLNLKVTGMPAIQRADKNVYLPQQLVFKVYGTCDTTVCSIARTEVTPTYVQLSQYPQQLEWTVVWQEVHSAWDEYLQTLLNNDDETHIQLASMGVCFALAFTTATVTLLGIRRKLKPFLKEGSSCWASMPHALNGGYQLRSLEHGIDTGENEHLLSTAEEASVNLDDANWRYLVGDVLRPPKYPRVLAILIGNGMFLLVQVFLLVVCAVIQSSVDVFVSVEGLQALIILLFSMQLSAVPAGYCSTKVLINLRILDTSGKTPWRVLLPSVWCSPVFMFAYACLLDLRRVMLGGTSSLQMNHAVVLIIVLLTAPMLASAGLVGFRLCCRLSPLPSLRVHPIARNLPKMSIRFIVICLFVPSAVIYTSFSAPVFFMLGSSFGSRPYYALSLLLCTTLVGIACSISGALLVVFVCLQKEIWNWHWFAYGSSSMVALYCCIGSAIFAANLRIGHMDSVVLVFHICIVSASLSCVCGAVAYLSALEFVNSIFQNKKYD